MSLTFVNHNGDPISATQMPAMRAEGADLERLAAKQMLRLSTRAGASQVSCLVCWTRQSRHMRGFGRQAANCRRFDDAVWLRTAKRTAVRSKSYILQEAAQQCKKMAIKTGRLDVHLLEIKKMEV